MKEIFQINNFDIIRLIAALQVAINHTAFDIGVRDSITFLPLRFFPGVPIFFFVSGFLISKSYETNACLKEYAKNRILRIYPALIVCTFVALMSVYLTGYLSDKSISMNEFLFWVVGQISIVQFYNPAFMREFGAGVLNRSLWTITVELQFYIMVPIIYWAFNLAKQKRNLWNLPCLIIFLMAFHIFYFSLMDTHSDKFIFKLFGVTFIPWIYMFLVGVFFQKNFSAFHRFLSEKVLYALPVYLGITYFSVRYLGWETGNGIHPVLYLLLATSVFSFAYSFPTLSKNSLRGNDISYGVYIYHVPIINIFLYYGYVSHVSYFILAMIGTILMAALSWFFVEKRFMKFKKHPLNPLNLGSLNLKT